MPRDVLERPSDDEPVLPSWGIRTAVSFLLFVQLFCVAVAILGNFGLHSGLEDQLVRTPGINQYLSLLHLNTAYNFHLVSGMADDWDHDILLVRDFPRDIEATPDDVTPYKTIALMPPGTWPGIRRQRLLMLALDLSQGDEDSEREAYLAEALANGLLHEVGLPPDATSSTPPRHRLVCREIQTQGMFGADAPPEDQQDPLATRWFSNAYEANVTPAGPRWSASRVVSAGEATRRRPSQRSGPSSEAPGKGPKPAEGGKSAPKVPTKGVGPGGAISPVTPRGRG